MTTSSNNRIFISGGSGFIGGHIITDLLKDSFDVFVLTRNKKNISTELGLPPQNILVGDISRLSDYSSVISSCCVFIHNAGEKSNVAKMKDINIGGMKSVIDELSKHPNTKLIYISSGGVYRIENHSKNVIDENSECLPGNEYEITKLEAEKILTKNSTSLKYIILRPTNVFGEHDNSMKLLNFFQSIKKGHFCYLDKSALVNYLYVKLLSSVIIEFIKRDLFTDEIFNVNSSCTIAEFVERSKGLLGVDKQIKTLPYFLVYPVVKLFDLFPKRIQFVNSIKYRTLTNKKIYSTLKLKQVLNLDEKKSLFEGLENLISYYKEKGLL